MRIKEEPFARFSEAHAFARRLMDFASVSALPVVCAAPSWRCKGLPVVEMCRRATAPGKPHWTRCDVFARTNSNRRTSGWLRGDEFGEQALRYVRAPGSSALRGFSGDRCLDEGEGCL